MDLSGLTKSGGSIGSGSQVEMKRQEDCKPDYAAMAERLKERLIISQKLSDAVDDYIESDFFDYRRCNELKSFWGHLIFENRQTGNEIDHLIALADKQ